MHYNLQALEWGEVPFERGRMTLIGNVLRAGPSTPSGLPMLMIGGEGDVDVYARDNVAVGRFGEALPMTGRYTTSEAVVEMAETPLDLPEGLVLLSSDLVERAVLANAGARPWDRDAHDVRILANVAEGRGGIIDSQEEVGGYPSMPETRRTFDPSQWNLATMEPLSTSLYDGKVKARGT